MRRISWHQWFCFAIAIGVGIALGWAVSQTRKEHSHDYKRSVGKVPSAPDRNVPPLSEEAGGGEKSVVVKEIWAEGGPPLFTSRRTLFFPESHKVEKVTAETKIGGLPLSWLEAHGLPADDPNVGAADFDGDGFDNRAEYEAGTDPKDPQSHPSYFLLLRVQFSEAHRFRMTFESRNTVGGEEVFQVNTPDGHAASHSVKIGQSFEGFRVKAYRSKEGPKTIGENEVIGDLSELELENEATTMPVVLIVKQEQNTPHVAAVFTVLLPHSGVKPVSIAQGQETTLEVNPDPARTFPEKLHFRLLSIDVSGAAMVADLEAGGNRIVPPLSATEKERMTASSSPSFISGSRP